MKLTPTFAGVIMAITLTSTAYAVTPPAQTPSIPQASQPAPTQTIATQPAAVQAAPAPTKIVAQAAPAPVAAPVQAAAPAKTVVVQAAPAVAPAPAPAKVMLAQGSAPASSATPNAIAITPLLPAPALTPAQQKQFEDLVHSYLVKNPEVIIEAIQALQQKQADQAQKAIQKTQELAPKFAEEIFRTLNDPAIGNAKGKVTVVDFFDYQCPHCTKMTPILETLTKSNANLRVVFKEFPIRGPISEFAAKAALAAKNQGKYFEFHKALMLQSASPQPLTEESILKTAKTVGLNIDKLKADMKSDAIAQQLKVNLKLGQDLQLLGTPAFFVAKSDVAKDAMPTAFTFIPGQIDQVQLQVIIDKDSKDVKENKEKK